MQSQLALSILSTSDIHGHIYPHFYGTKKMAHHGLGKLATLIKRTTQHTDNFLLIDNGDIIQGTPLTDYYAKYQRIKPNPLIVVMNALKYDAAVIGNHEFNYGLELLNSVVSRSNFPWLSANIQLNSTKEPYFGTPYMVKQFGELKIAVLGITTQFIPNWEKPDHIKNLFFESALQSAKRWVPYIHEVEKPNLLIVAYHGGFERDFKTGELTETETGENEGYRLCMEVPGIDILITGHQHRTIVNTEVNGVTVIQPGSKGEFLGKIDLTFQKKRYEWRLASIKSELLSTEEVTADEEILKTVEAYEKETQDWLDQMIGEVDGDMSVADPLLLRMKEHPLTEFINKVQMEVAGVDVSCTALFHEESPGFSGKVSMRDIVSNYIYPNTLTVIRLSGKEIREALERTASYFMVDSDDKIVVNPEFSYPKPQHYNYDMWEGIEYELTISYPIGKRVTKLEYKGKEIKADHQFDVVMNHYRAGGGGGYNMFKNKPVIKQFQQDMTELLAEYFKKSKVVKPTVNHNWKITC